MQTQKEWSYRMRPKSVSDDNRFDFSDTIDIHQPIGGTVYVGGDLFEIDSSSTSTGDITSNTVAASVPSATLAEATSTTPNKEKRFNSLIHFLYGKDLNKERQGASVSSTLWNSTVKAVQTMKNSEPTEQQCIDSWENIPDHLKHQDISLDEVEAINAGGVSTNEWVSLAIMKTAPPALKKHTIK
eukprot:TRINITY_DN23316_c0_g1_i1.p1 TRINITY_DN23316_c0_g1~~TRINITY_DN23316_c0_g1_i1.p1  ORF type:complete len:185 (+),score=13.42 TRINITY_DN23316_c0_g1_i1:293-847(+)